MPGHEMNESWIEATLSALKERLLREHDALCAIVHAANANSHPIHYKVREAIDRGREALREMED